MARRTWLLLPLLTFALGAGAQTMPSDVEIGYRWLDISGNSDMYRTQINERSGVLLRSFTLSTVDFDGHTSLIDHFRIDVSDLGAGPAGSLRIEAGKTGSYRFNMRYRRADAFSALPAFANPLLGAGIVPGQHTFDRRRNMVDADVELLRFSKFTPFAGVSWNRYDGPGTTTYHVGQDEFRLTQELRDTDRELRVGTGFDFGVVSGQVTQGWRRFRGNETLSLAPGAGNGNNTDPVLGRQITIGSFSRNDSTNVDTPFTSLYVTGQATPRIRLLGNYARFTADTDGDGSEELAGSLASFALSRFYNGLSEQSSARAKNTTWRGGGRAEVKVVEGVDFLASYQREHRELTGSALINTIFLQSITFGGADPRDVQTILSSSSSLDRDEDVASAALSAHVLGPFSMRAGFSTSKQDVTVAPDLSEIAVPGSQGGTFHRRVNTFDISAAYTRADVTLGLAWKKDNANDPILRTDFLDRDRLRARAAWKAPKYFRAGLTAEETHQTNDRPEVAYDAKIRQYTGDVEVTPVQMVVLRASATRFRSDSNTLFRRPENFNTDTSIHIEKGHSVEGGVSLVFPRVTLDGDLSRFDNKGSLPFTIDRSRARVTFQLFTKTGLAAEWAHDKYRESNLTLADYEANRYGIYLRLTP